MNISDRPWGHYRVLYDGDDCKVKKIVVKPKQLLSYQYHFKRDEHWTIISGTGYVTLDGDRKSVKSGDTIFIPSKMRHTIENTSNKDLCFIEVQTGSYFGEDDIVRLVDKYGRK